VSFLGIPDPWVWSAYILCFLSAALCVIYGVLNWNAEEEEGKTPPDLNEMEEKPLDEAFEKNKEGL